VSLSWTERVRQFKSPLCVVAAFLLRSRETQATRARELAEENRRLKQLVEQQQAALVHQSRELAQKNVRIAELEKENARLRTQPPVLPHDPPLPHHHFGPKMIALCVNLACRIGLRATPDVLHMVLQWLQVDGKVPDWTTVRTWLLRAGVAAIERPVEEADDWILMADHSNQIGPEKALSIIGIRAANLPPPGQSIRHEDVRVLELTPGTSWKREDMAHAYQQLAERCGTPLALVVDGAVELREGAEILQENGEKEVLVLGDFKHHAANVLKKTIGAEDRFGEFSAHLGRTRCAIQQTELSHFTPPSPKPKARFMNLAPMLGWATMLLWHLGHPNSGAREGITAQRMNEKLGWLRGFRSDILRWGRCQQIVSTALTFVNKQGLFRGAADMLHACIEPLMTCDVSKQVGRQLLDYLRQCEAKLAAGQRLPISTEILESSFGLFKQLERQHSKGGFTSLLPAYGCLLHSATAESIRRDFAQVSVKQAKEWVAKKLGKTLMSKRQQAYREFRQAA